MIRILCILFFLCSFNYSSTCSIIVSHLYRDHLFSAYFIYSAYFFLHILYFIHHNFSVSRNLSEEMSTPFTDYPSTEQVGRVVLPPPTIMITNTVCLIVDIFLLVVCVLQIFANLLVLVVWVSRRKLRFLKLQELSKLKVFRTNDNLILLVSLAFIDFVYAVLQFPYLIILIIGWKPNGIFFVYLKIRAPQYQDIFGESVTGNPFTIAQRFIETRKLLSQNCDQFHLRKSQHIDFYSKTHIFRSNLSKIGNGQRSFPIFVICPFFAERFSEIMTTMS